MKLTNLIEMNAHLSCKESSMCRIYPKRYCTFHNWNSSIHHRDDLIGSVNIIQLKYEQDAAADDRVEIRYYLFLLDNMLP